MKWRAFCWTTLIGLSLAAVALGQSIPNGNTPLTQGQVWTTSQWNTAWQAKVDGLNGASTNEILTTPTINTPTMTSSGTASIAGTWTGAPTLTGNLTLSGNPSFTGSPSFTTGVPSFGNGASLTGTFSGTPTFSGALTLSGTPVFTAGAALGTGTYSGAATLSGNVTFSGTPVFSTGASLTGTFTGNPTLSGNPILSGTPQLTGTLSISHAAVSATAPTISSGFGTSPSIITNGTMSGQITVGTGGATTGVLTMPAANTGWACAIEDITTQSAAQAYSKETAYTTTSVTFNAYSDVAATGAWAASDKLVYQCTAF